MHEFVYRLERSGLDRVRYAQQAREFAVDGDEGDRVAFAAQLFGCGFEC